MIELAERWDKHVESYRRGEVFLVLRRRRFPPSFGTITEWLDKRNHAKHKAHLQRWLREWQLDTIKGFLGVTQALGLNDTLWVRRADESLTWEQVSLYTNRHLGNFGFIVDNETFKVKRFAPVFDHNMALAARAMNSEDVEYTKSLGHKLGADFITAAKVMLTPRIRSILRQLQGFEFTRHKSYNLPAKRLRVLNSLVQGQVKAILR